MRRFKYHLLFLIVIALLLPCAVAYADQFLNDPYVVASGGLQWRSDAAYNPARNEYCMTWNNGYYIKWRRLDSTGAVIGSEYTVYDGVTNGHHFSEICYNSARAEYLIVYIGWLDAGGTQTRAVRVDATTGNQIGSAIFIDNVGMTTTGGLDVAYSPTSNSYIAVYENYGEGNIYFKILDTYGNPITGRLQIDTPSQQYSRNCQVAWNSANNEYLVTYMGYIADPAWDYWAQRVRASDGALLGSNLQITGSHNVYNFGGVAYDSNANRYLVVWDGGGSPPYGQLVTNTATLYGSTFPIGAGNSIGWAAAVCYDSAKREYLVSWSGSLTSANYSRRVSQNGVCINDAFSNVGGWEGVGIGNWPPRPVYNSVNDEFLIHWHNSYAYILDRRFKSTAAAPQPPGPVTNFAAAAGNGQNVLTWVNSGGSQTGTLIRFKTTGYPTSTSDGAQIYDSSGATYTHSGLTNGIAYYYTAWARDAVPLYSNPAYAAATPSTTPGLVIVPLPQEWTWKAGTGFLVNGSTQIMANSNPDAKEQNMALQLQRKVWDTTGYLPAIVYGGSATSNVIAVGDPARCPAVNSIVATWSEMQGRTSKTEGYMLGVKDTSIVIRGWDNAGTFYGSQTLIQLFEYFKTTRITPVFSYDYPELPYRGVYMRVKWEHDWKFTKELISEMITRYKCNYYSPEIHMNSVSHPEIEPPNENPVLLSSAQDLLNFTTTHYLNNVVTWYPGPPQGTPIPEECLFDPVRLARVDDLANDVKVYLNPPCVHVHESELSSLGCASDRAQYSNEYIFNQLLWQDWNRNYVSRGMWPFMWADMLRPDMGGGTMGTANVVATMPDMIIADWQYGTPGAVPTDYPSLDRWIQYNRKAVGTPFGLGSFPAYNQYYGDKENIYYWANAVFNRRGSHPNNMLGLLAWNKYMANNRNVVVGSTTDNLWQQQCLGCYPYYAEWAWNPNGRYWNPYPYGNGWSMVERQISPDRVSNFSATPSGANVILNWTNPPESKFTATYIVYRTDRFATSPIDGTYLADVAGSPSAPGTYTHVSAPQNGAYYSVFARDNVRHFAPEATAYVGPAGVCYQETFTYANGALVGQGGWTGSATASHIAIENGSVKLMEGSVSKDAIKTLSCAADATGYITVTCKINGEVGTDTGWNLWYDDASAKNFARWYGSGTTVRGRIGTTGTVTATQTLSGAWQTIKVKIHPANNTTEFFFEGVSLGVYSHAVTGVGDVLGRIRFERINAGAASGQYLYFDDLQVGEAAVQTNNAQYISDNIPASMVAGSQYNVTVTMRNTGTTTWSYTDGYKLGGVDNSDPFVSGTPRVLLNPGETVAPNAQRAFNFTMTAPATAGTYTTDWRMVKEWVEWFGDTLTKTVIVNASGFCFQDEFNYPAGALNGNGGWTGSAGASQIETVSDFVRIWGGATSYDAIKTVNCTSQYIWVRILAYLGSGADTTWSFWVDDSSGRNFGRWYGSGTTARGRIGGTSNVTAVQNLHGGGLWDSLVMKIDPAANTTQFFYNGTDLGVLSHASEGTADVVGRVRFERVNNSAGAGQFVYLDNVRISSN